MLATQVEPAVATSGLLMDEPEDRSLFKRNFDHHPFLFRHSLETYSAFSLESLLAAAERMKSDKSHYESGTPERNSWFGSRPQGTSLVEALASIQSGSSWVILKRIHEDAVYRDILHEIVPELSALAGVDIAREYYDPTMTIFITSPGRITPYHMDGETNFLAQIAGTKHVYVYDGTDRSILPETHMERYWTGGLPKIELPEDKPHGTWQWLLEPGNGLFNPAIFPHWLQNGPEVSISVSINFKLRRNTVIGAYRTNHFLRRLGMKPTPPGKSAALDRAKEATFGRLYAAAKSLKK